MWKNFVVHPLTSLIYRCLMEDIFLVLLKKSIVVPIFKSGRKNNLANYRTISLLPVIFKVLKKIINNRPTKFLEDKRILSGMQYGFGKGRPTTDWFHSFTELLVSKINNEKKMSGGLYRFLVGFQYCLSKANHAEIRIYGRKNTQLKLFQVYLQNRFHSIRSGNIQSDDRFINIVSFCFVLHCVFVTSTIYVS